jgi:hypothetical protein
MALTSALHADLCLDLGQLRLDALNLFQKNLLQFLICLCVLNFVHQLLQLLHFLRYRLVFTLSRACFDRNSGSFGHVWCWFGCEFFGLLLFGMLLGKNFFGRLLLIDFLDAFVS